MDFSAHGRCYQRSMHTRVRNVRAGPSVRWRPANHRACSSHRPPRVVWAVRPLAASAASVDLSHGALQLHTAAPNKHGTLKCTGGRCTTWKELKKRQVLAGSLHG